jgi:hypothetical protein
VRLSPKATNLVTARMAGGTTVTTKVHDARRCRASVAVQLTVVTPRGNSDPLAGEHVTVTGGAPPVTAEELYVTGGGGLVCASRMTESGHRICGGSGIGGGVG